MAKETVVAEYEGTTFRREVSPGQRFLIIRRVAGKWVDSGVFSSLATAEKMKGIFQSKFGDQCVVLNTNVETPA